MNSDLRKGDKFASPNRPDNHVEVLDCQVHDGNIHVYDSFKKSSRWIALNDIRTGVSNGSLILQRKGGSRVSIAAQYDDHQLHRQVAHLNHVLRRIDAIQARKKVSFNVAFSLARAEYVAETEEIPLAPIFPSKATLYRAHRKNELGLPVLKGNKNKGNATARYAPALVEFVEEVLKNYYLVTESKWTVLDITRYVNREARKLLLHIATHDISRKFIQTRINALTPDPEYDRMDVRQRIAGKSIAKRRIQAAFPFSRIEQDAVHLPFVVKTPHGISRNVYLVVAIDACTGYPVGWHLVVGAPREMDSLYCLEMYLTPGKDARFEQFSITGALNIFGTPVVVIFDNGTENIGLRIVRLARLGIDVWHCKAREAQGKPFVERFNGSMKNALQRLPGCTRFDGKDGARDPEERGDVLMTIDELEKWIVRWMYKEWINSPLDRHIWDELLMSDVKGKTPLERMKYSTEDRGQPIPLPRARSEWISALYEHKQCVLSAKTGITVLHGFRYNGEPIGYLLKKYGDHASLHIIYNPDDFRRVFVFEGDDLPLVTLVHERVQADTPAWTFNEAKSRFDASAKDWTTPEEKLQFQQEMDLAVTGARGGPQRKTRGKREENYETGRRAKAHYADRRAENNPLPEGTLPSHRPSPATSLLAQEMEDDSASYDDVPLMNIVNRSTGEELL